MRIFLLTLFLLLPHYYTNSMDTIVSTVPHLASFGAVTITQVVKPIPKLPWQSPTTIFISLAFNIANYLEEQLTVNKLYNYYMISSIFFPSKINSFYKLKQSLLLSLVISKSLETFTLIFINGFFLAYNQQFNSSEQWGNILKQLILNQTVATVVLFILKNREHSNLK